MTGWDRCPIAERSKLSDRGLGDPGSNPGEGRFFSAFFQDGELNKNKQTNKQTPYKQPLLFNNKELPLT